MTTPERRAHPRFDIRLSAEIRHGTTTFTATTRDLSAGGCCIESAYPLPEGQLVELGLFVVVDGVEDDAMPPLRLGARVQWVAEPEVLDAGAAHLAGLRFEGATDQQRAWIEGVLRRAC